MEERIKRLEYSNSLLVAILETLYPKFSGFLSSEEKKNVMTALKEAKGE
ncbi:MULTISPECIES: hypothetical protein [Leptospira]|uniref:Uncharacterized protein n=3 Tax=Leptospira interrogans TaxID=173 RepID=M6GN00_LEPIR|nr:MULTISPECIES: hypothetical protein [Leptospira]EMF44559.1 hypothetical protein LEP1GSC067_3619 [Leptospira interrogans serovar Lora str. TE 1992]EMM83924.1 hypothetical protein LEP1GSC037_4634 [Leptospira interrogans str. 2006001854]EKR25557.1 hypothetical protein LEP1GSC087_2964 [Leptospira interrogans serovar Bataviae str. L1111]EKR33926.1 hypothetical protein LEP1GSC096_2092 [Leptospira interrogans serovar Hebdomadis str. R499]EMJ37980.1 hypothetical protein LEP1GSC079_1823 [Leptospira i